MLSILEYITLQTETMKNRKYEHFVKKYRNFRNMKPKNTISHIL